MDKVLAKYSELSDPRWVSFMDELNSTARRGGLCEYKTYSRIWEYPWLWFQLRDLPRKNTRVLDSGSERSPFPWYLATQGFDVMVSDVTADYWGVWKVASRSLGVKPHLKILDAQDLALPTGSIDVYESISILEHVPDKPRALDEAARVLRPGGLLLMTFDVCEPEMGMTFPEWNGRAVSMREVDQLFTDSRWFETGVGQVRWNTGDIPRYLAWHRTTAPHHNYVTGAIAVRRNQELWPPEHRNERFAELSGACRASAQVLKWRAKNMGRRIKQLLPAPVRSALTSGLSRFRKP